MKLNFPDSNDEIYTGVLRFKNDNYHFVLSDTKLRLIPCSEEQRASMWKFGMKEITKGTYTQIEPPRIKEDKSFKICQKKGLSPQQGSLV